MSKPLFFIIAGPNGAGKSTSSAQMLEQYNIVAFDWDAEFYKLWAKFGYDPAVEKGVKDRTTELFNKHVDDALEFGKNVAYETNFHIDYHFERERIAKEKGFETVLYFFFVESTDVCRARVKLRHALGGHFVDDKTVNYRWKQGLKRLDKAIALFNQVLIFDTTNDYKIELLAIVGSNKPLLTSHNNTLLKELPSLKNLLDETSL